jgi:hypothetical protein
MCIGGPLSLVLLRAARRRAHRAPVRSFPIRSGSPSWSKTKVLLMLLEAERGCASPGSLAHPADRPERHSLRRGRGRSRRLVEATVPAGRQVRDSSFAQGPPRRASERRSCSNPESRLRTMATEGRSEAGARPTATRGRPACWAAPSVLRVYCSSGGERVDAAQLRRRDPEARGGAFLDAPPLKFELQRREVVVDAALNRTPCELRHESCKTGQL